MLAPGQESDSFQFQERAVLAPVVCRSTDGGRTWERGGSVALPASGPPPIPFGDIVAGPGGLLATTFYSWHEREKNTAYFYTSNDAGRAWSPRAAIGADDCNETALLWLGGDRWLAACRPVPSRSSGWSTASACGTAVTPSCAGAPATSR